MKKFYLLIIIILGGGLRFYALTDQSFWFDEIYIAQNIQNFSYQQLQFLWFNENHPPLYIIFLKGWTSWFGDSEWSMRACSAFLGTVTLPVFYKLLSVLASRTTSLVSVALFAISPLAIYYSQEVRYFSLWIPLSSLSFYFFFLWLRKQKNTYISWCLITILALFTHIYSVFILFIQLVLFIREGLKTKLPMRFWISLIGIFCSFLIITWWVWLHLGNAAGYPKPFSIAHYAYIPFAYTLGFSFGPSVRELHLMSLIDILTQEWRCGVATGIIAFVLATAIPAIWRDRQSRDLCILVMFCFGIIAATPLFSRISFNIRSTLFLAPFFYLYLGIGVQKLMRHPFLRIFPIVLIVLMLVSLSQYFTMPIYARDDIRSTARVIRMKPDVPVLTTPMFTRKILNFYGVDPKQKIRVFSPAAIQEVQDNAFVFLIWNRPWGLKNATEYEVFFNKHYSVIDEHDFSGVKIQLVKSN